MARIITKFGYLKPNSKQKASGYAKYIATREGVEKPIETKTYADYIATRPRSHGLFSNTYDVSLSQVSKEIDEHNGNIWTGIISLTREDAERLGYATSEDWQRLLCSEMETIAKSFKIPMANLKWYGAFHNESYHPHVHLIFYSTDEKEGYLSKKGIENIRSELANSIFEQDMISVYQKQTEYRDEIKNEVREKTQQIAAEINDNADYSNSNLEKMMATLTERLSKTSGKKVYGYLSASNKKLVDEIVREIAKDPKIAELYELWYQQKENTIAMYTDTMPERIPLWSNPEFKAVRNIVVKTAAASESNLQEVKKGAYDAFFAFDLLCNVANIFQNKIDDSSDKKGKVDKKQKGKTIEKREAHGLHY